ncbi:MAG TPA: (Fe-S)-binding protein [Dehalococcoidia bacterium]|nr:(Fe-S)-binding protein [Dehalococcoidia bacterium]
MAPSTEFPGNLFYALTFFGFLTFFVYSVGVRFRWFLRGQWVDRFTRPVERAIGLIPWLVGNARVVRPRYWYSGLLHTMIWWGFIVLQIRTLNFLLNGVDDSASLEAIFGSLYDGLRPVMDAFNILVIVGTGMAAFQRFVWRPARLTLNWDAWIILGLIAWLMVTDVFTHSFDIYLVEGENEGLSFLAYGVAQIWDGAGMSVGTAEGLHTAFWYMHLLDFLVFLCYLPYSKHSHVLTIAPQVFTRRLAPTGVLDPIPDFEKAESFGVGKLEALTWKQMLDSYTCTECGRCTAACPANLTGKLLSPKEVIVDIRHLLEEREPAIAPWTKRPEQPTPLIEGVGFEPIWDCVTCGACMYECPVFIEHVPTIMDMRRYLVMEEANMPETAQATLMQLEQRGHPWRGAQLTRTTWMEEMAAEGTQVPLFDGSQEYLLWVGCSGALQERNVKVTKATARLLLEAGVSFGVLGNEEGCSGDPARRLGNEYLYQMQAQANIDVFKAKGVQKVLTMCPHCFNTMRHEYPQLDGRFEVLHHSVFLEELIAQGRLRPQATNGLSEKTATYHDPCYIARHNDILDEPRRVIAATGATQAEMPRCKRGTFCCGAGGGHMWVEESRGQRINDVRTEEAASTGADIIAVACPFCMQMFESSVGSVPQAAERGMQVFDLSELVEMSVTYSRPAPSPAAAPVDPPTAADAGTNRDAE